MYLTKGLNEAGMTLADLPEVTCSNSAGRSGLCWKFLCGNCDGGESCKYVHALPSELTDELVEELVPTVKKMVGGLEKVKQGQKKNKRKRKLQKEERAVVKFG